MSIENRSAQNAGILSSRCVRTALHQILIPRRGVNTFESSFAGEGSLQNNSSENVHIVLRGYVDDISFKVPRLLATHAVQILCIVLRPTGARFSDKKRQKWDINKERC